MGETLLKKVHSAKHDRFRELGRQQLYRNVTVSIKFVASTRWNFGIRWIEKPNSHVARHLSWDTLPPGRTQDMTATETFHITTVLAQIL